LNGLPKYLYSIDDLEEKQGRHRLTATDSRSLDWLIKITFLHSGKVMADLAEQAGQ
jgi:hypothetical protein